MAEYQPNLILAATGSIMILPGTYGILYTDKYYGSISTVLLGLTSIGFHSTHYHTLALIDKFVIFNFVMSGYYHTYYDYSDKVFAQLVFATIFNISVFFVGMKYNILCFDPDVRVQTFYHMLIHFFSADIAHKIFS